MDVNNRTTEIVLWDADERVAPPEQPVLRLSRVGDVVFFDLCTVDVDSTESTVMSKLGTVGVDMDSLYNALICLELSDPR